MIDVYFRTTGRIRYFVKRLLAFAIFMFAGGSISAATDGVPLGITLSGPPGQQTPELVWPSQTGAVYNVQSRTDLAASGRWNPSS